MEAVLPTGGQIWSILGGHGGQNVKKEDALPTGGHVASLGLQRPKIHFRPFYEINCQIGYGNATKMACPKK